MSKFLSLSNVLLMVSTGSILLAIGLAGGSLAKSVKWDFYNSATNYGVDGDPFVQLYAYQNLWTSYDAYNGRLDTEHAQAYELIKKGMYSKIIVRVNYWSESDKTSIKC